MNRQPVWAKQELAGMDDHSGLGGSFIEADLTAQHLWVYQDGEVILESDLVSGVMTEYSHTPDGVWILDYKETDTTLLGDINEEGVYGYAEYVYYWMRLNDEGIGLHDATWREYFGGDIYIDYGSHGCLNLPLDVAMQIYNYIDETTPVIIYYAEPYELHEESFSGLSLGPVFTQVHFLDPIYYEDYRDKSTREIADLVKHRIEERIAACA